MAPSKIGQVAWNCMYALARARLRFLRKIAGELSSGVACPAHSGETWYCQNAVGCNRPVVAKNKAISLPPGAGVILQKCGSDATWRHRSRVRCTRDSANETENLPLVITQREFHHISSSKPKRNESKWNPSQTHLQSFPNFLVSASTMSWESWSSSPFNVTHGLLPVNGLSGNSWSVTYLQQDIVITCTLFE